MIQLIVDSTCDLPQNLLQQYDIQMMPLHVFIHEREYKDKVDIGIDKVYAQMRQGVLPKTTQIPPTEIYKVFQECAKKGNDFIYLAFSSALSGTCNVANIVKEEVAKQYPYLKMAVMDSKAGALATGLMALQTAKMLQKHIPYEQVLQQIQFMSAHIEHLFSIADLNWLVKGGRVGKVVGKAGSIMNIKPILDVEDGFIKVIGATRGRKKMIRTITDLVAERIKAFPDQIIGINHADDYDLALEMQAELQTKLGLKKFIIEQIGCVLGTHLGIGGVGVFFLNSKPDFYEF